jgi:hypothetical protein
VFWVSPIFIQRSRKPQNTFAAFQISHDKGTISNRKAVAFGLFLLQFKSCIRSSADLGCPLDRLLRQAVRQIGLYQAEDHFVLLCSPHEKAGTESPSFHGHALRQVGCTRAAYIFVASRNSLEGVKYGIAHFFRNIFAMSQAQRHRCHGAWLHGLILSAAGIVSRAARLLP